MRRVHLCVHSCVCLCGKWPACEGRFVSRLSGGDELAEAKVANKVLSMAGNSSPALLETLWACVSACVRVCVPACVCACVCM